MTMKAVRFDRGTLELPPDPPPELAYRIIVGLYDPVTGARLPVSGTGADFVELSSQIALP